jgi:hypothetical protein
LDLARLVRWLYALGIGFLMYAGTLFLFTLYRPTEQAVFAAGICALASLVLFVTAITIKFRENQR